MSSYALQAKSAAAFLCACLLWPSAARARVSDGPWLQPGELALWSGLGITQNDEQFSSLLVLSPLFSGRYALSELSFGLDWGFAAAVASPASGGDDAVFRSGNPFFSAQVQGGNEKARWRAGLGAFAPLAWVSTGGEGRLQRAAYNHAMGMRGLWDSWLFAPEHTGVAALFAFEQRFGTYFLLSAETAACGMIPVGDFDDDVDILLQAAGGLGVVEGMTSVGFRLQIVLMPTLSEDQAQTAISPWIRFDPGEGFAELAATFNLDQPLGGGYGMRMYGLQLSGGLVF